MSEHVKKEILEKLYLAPAEVSEQEKKDAHAHLAACTLCKESSLKLQSFYEEMDKTLKTPPTERDEALAEKLLAPQKRTLALNATGARKEDALDTYVEILEPHPRPLVRRIVRYMQVHPVRFAGATTFTTAAMVLALLAVRPVKDTNPSFASIKDYVLTVYNKEAEVLWRKGMLGIPDRSSEIQVMPNGEQRFLQMGDLDGDGINEILVSGANRLGSFTLDSLYCYEHDGSLRWKINSGPIISFGDTTIQQHSIAAIRDILVMKQTAASHPQLFILANELNFSPTKLAELDPKTGKELQAYYNRGGSGPVMSYDLDGDGKAEILLTGINDGFNRAYLSVLDPSDINGHAPVPPRYEPHNVPEAREKYYLLFPRTYFGMHYSNDPYNLPQNVWTTRRKVHFQISETLQEFPIKDMNAQVVYSIDSMMRVQSVVAGNGFIKAQEYLLQKGALNKPLLPDYLNKLRDSVLYWDGERFVSSPTRNRRYPISTLSKN